QRVHRGRAEENSNYRTQRKHREDRLGKGIARLGDYVTGYGIFNLNVSWINAKFLHAVKQGAALYTQAKGRSVWSTNAAFSFLKYPHDSFLFFEVLDYTRGINC